ncbi:MAG: phosphoribosylformylglycinamidine synthase subunit PurL [Ignavibacteria bacterium]|nr:phosphoribosylformylglycinamidine synthase subunit PurL [Ignavibacteria bacterium]
MIGSQELTEPVVDLRVARELGLTEDEYDAILRILGRTPTYTELGIYSVMWSEHCSYKNSIAVLKTLPREGKGLLAGAGEENAGLVDIGNGLAVAFKIESHNHPSAIEPYQGAATGVGGILRDIFTMGARPIAALNSLRFGNPKNARVRYLLKNVVKGIGDYGNSFGVPTVAGEVYFDDCYNGNPLVNAMAVGIVKTDHIARAVAGEPGSAVMIVGSATGKDGIHGATFASVELSGESEARRPAVQVGDPFTEKALLEATLEAIQSGHVVGIQDMGAAGLTCSSTEMSAKGRVGMRLNLDNVPLRDQKMSSYEIMLSESQERMLLVARKGHEEAINKIFRKWDLAVSMIGEVSAGSDVEVFQRERLKARVPAETLVLGGGAPVYHREARLPGYIAEVRDFAASDVMEPADCSKVLLELLGSPTIGSKRPVYEQYDSMVQTSALLGPGESDAAVVRIEGTTKALALKTDCNAAYVYLNPRRGGEIAVAEAARNVVCSGGKPIAITNCLNFGNPYDPEVFWQFKEAVAGIGAACRVLETPVTGGNVSFYNESPEGAVFPTPVIGMLGIIDDLAHVTRSAFDKRGDAIILLGKTAGHLGGSQYLHRQLGSYRGDAPEMDLAAEQALQQTLLALIRSRLVQSAHDISEGGLAVALAECCMGAHKGVGAVVTGLSMWSLRKDYCLFGEDQSRVIITVQATDVDEVMRRCGNAGVDSQSIGSVTSSGRLVIEDWIDVSVAAMQEQYEGAVMGLFGIEGREA